MPRRVMIIGGAGSGKSTAARAIGDALGLPVYHMDREVYWLPNWEERPNNQRRAIVREIAARPEWVFEGSFSATFKDRLDRADMLIWLDVNVALRLFRVIRRTIKYRGQSRPDLAEGCVEELGNLPEFIGFIMRTRRGAQGRSSRFFGEARIEKHRFTSARQVNRFVADLRTRDETNDAPPVWEDQRTATGPTRN